MGFIDRSDAAWMPVFYNVAQAVGLGCPNQANDVRLVQHLLKAVYEKQSPNSKPEGALEVDGVCGSVTMNWIRKFQFDCNQSDGSPAGIVDLRIDRVANRSLYTKRGNNIYSLAELNYNAMRDNPEAWANTQNVVPLAEINRKVMPPGYEFFPTLKMKPMTGKA